MLQFGSCQPIQRQYNFAVRVVWWVVEMAEEQHHLVTITVLSIGRRDFAGEPFATLVTAINDAWEQIPEKHRDAAGFELVYEGGLRVWYDRPETEVDTRERLEYERLKEKFSRERRT